VKDFSQAVLNSIHEKSHYMKILNTMIRHDNAMLKVTPLLRHMYWDHVYNTASHPSRVLHELQGLLIGTGHRKAITPYVQVGSGVEGLQNPEG
jgi:hypothetical protein